MLWHKKIQFKHRLLLFLQLTPGTKVKMLYFWFLMAFLGNFSSHFSGQPSQTVRAFSSFFLRHMWARQSQQLRGGDVNMNQCKHITPPQDSKCVVTQLFSFVMNYYGLCINCLTWTMSENVKNSHCIFLISIWHPWIAFLYYQQSKTQRHITNNNIKWRKAANHKSKEALSKKSW